MKARLRLGHAACASATKEVDTRCRTRRSATCPRREVDQYSHHQKEAFLEAFNSALKQYGEEGRAFAVAHAAAQRTPEKDPTPGD